MMYPESEARLSPPSQRDGLRPEQVAGFKRTAIATIIEAGTNLHMDQIAIATAVVFLHRFYHVHSLVRNDPFLVSMACLYLGGKVEDSPKSVRDVVLASCQIRYRDAARRLPQEREVQEALKEQVFVAERAVLYALNFRFNVQHAYKPCISMLSSEPLKSQRERLLARDPRKAQQLAQFAFNLINDSLKTEACLWYSGTQVAAAAIWLAMKLLKEDTHLYTPRKQLWWAAWGVREEDLRGVTDLLQELYTQDLYATAANNNLAFQSAAVLRPQHVAGALAAERERERQHPAAAYQHKQQWRAAAQPQPPAAATAAAAGAAALPAAVAAANRESWAALAAPPQPPSQPPLPPHAAAAAAPAPPPPPAAAADEDYDDLLAELD